MSAAVSLPVPTRLARVWHHWTAHEDATLSMGWGIRPIQTIATDLKRTPNAVYKRAALLELGVGCPQGFEYVSDAAKRVGFHHTTLKNILRWASVFIRPAAARPGSKGRERIVEPSDVDVAVARWCACETIEQAGRRLGYSGCTVRRALLAAEKRGEISLGARHGWNWRVPSAVVDKVFAIILEREDQVHAARRVGVSAVTLRTWLIAAGVPRGTSRTRWWVAPSAVDRVVAAKRATGTRAFRGTTNTQGGTS